jgi:Flp pilus assembly protein TadG
MQLKCQRGAQIVEFAFALPFLVLMIFLIIDFGFLVFNKAVLTNASREAARYATVLTATPWSTTAVAAVACNYARTSLISTRSGTHTATCSGSADPTILVSNPNGNIPPQFGDPITVQISYLYSGFLTSTTTFILGVPAWNITTESKMNHE